MNIITTNYRYLLTLILIIILFYLFYQYFLKFYNYYFFKKYGYLTIGEGINDKDCNDILLVINKELGKVDSEYSWNEKHRKNLRVPLELEIKNIINKILNNKNLEKIWEKFTPNPILAESSIFLTYPKAGNQPWHRDIKLKDDYADMITIGIALDDINEDMSILELYPKSMEISDKSLIKLKDKYNNNYLEDLKYKKKRIICKKGSIIIWNSKLIHRGSKNTSNTIRPLFYFSFLEGDKPRQKGPTYSLKSTYKHKIYVNEL